MRKCEERNENVENQHGYVRNLGGNAENAENVGNQGGNLSIAAEMT